MLNIMDVVKQDIAKNFRSSRYFMYLLFGVISFNSIKKKL